MWVDNTTHKSHRIVNENKYQYQGRLPPYKSLVREAPKPPKQYRQLLLPLVAHILLDIPHVSVAE